MSYQAVVEMATNNSLLNRITACAAAEGVENPKQWAQVNFWNLCASPDWDDAWDYAKNTATANTNPDIGMRDDVIGDDKILAAVQLAMTPTE